MLLGSMQHETDVLPAQVYTGINSGLDNLETQANIIVGETPAADCLPCGNMANSFVLPTHLQVRQLGGYVFSIIVLTFGLTWSRPELISD